MGKLPVLRDRFRIICEADATLMGQLLAHMTRMGVKDISYELLTDVRTFRNNGPRKVHDVTAKQLVLNYLAEHPTFAIGNLMTVFKAAGRPASAAYGAVHVLVDDKVLNKLGGGNYQRADVKALTATKGKVK
jgi:hypothetical protein